MFLHIFFLHNFTYHMIFVLALFSSHPSNHGSKQTFGNQKTCRFVHIAMKKLYQFIAEDCSPPFSPQSLVSIHCIVLQLKCCPNKLQGFTTQGQGFRLIRLPLQQQEVKLHHHNNNHTATHSAWHAAALTSHPNSFLCCRVRLAWQELPRRTSMFNHCKLLLHRYGEGA